MANFFPYGKPTGSSFYLKISGGGGRCKETKHTVIAIPPAPVWLFHLELSADAVDEELPAVLARIHQSRAADLWPHAANDVLHLIVWEQVRNLSWNG